MSSSVKQRASLASKCFTSAAVGVIGTDNDEVADALRMVRSTLETVEVDRRGAYA